METSSNTEVAALQTTGTSQRGSTTFVGSSGETVMANPNKLLACGELQDLRKAFSRPFIISRGTLVASSNPVQIYFGAINDIFTGSPYRALLNFNFGVRFTTHLKLIVAHTPMVQGMLQLCHLPLGRTVNYDRVTYTPCVNQLKHATLTLNSSNECTLCVPWDSPYDFLPLSDPGFTTSGVINHALGGEIALQSTLPISIGDGSTPSYVLYASFHDIEVIGETPILTAYAQMADDPAMAEIAPTGVISRPLYIGSQLLGSMSYISDKFGVFPTLSRVFGTASWLTRLGSKALSAFGFSRPPVLTTAGRMWQQNSGYSHIADIADYSVPLSLFNDNKVIPDTKVCNPEDEMSLEYLLTRPGVISRFNWGSSKGSGDTLMAIQTCPANMVFVGANTFCDIRAVASGLNVTYFPSPLAYYGQAFKQWRGSMIFRLRTAKTPFHGGRILIGWVPVSNSTISATNTIYWGPPNNQHSFISKVWDLKAETEIEFTVPFLSLTPYRDYASATGVFFVRVLDPLVYSASVANNVDMLLDVRAGDDFEFAVPTTPTFWYNAPNPLVNPVAQISDAPGLVSISEPADGGRQPNADTPECVDCTAATHAVGEKVTSLKQLGVRSGVLSALDNPYGPSVIPPWAFTSPTPSASGITAYTLNDYINFISSSYAYYVGGYCLDAVPFDNSITTMATLNEVNILNKYGTLGVAQDCQPWVIENTGKAVHVRIPFYSALRHVPVTNWAGTNPLLQYLNPFLTQPPPYPLICAKNNSASGHDATIYYGRRLSEESRFYRYLGPPPCVFGAGNGTAASYGGTYYGTVLNGKPV